MFPKTARGWDYFLTQMDKRLTDRKHRLSLALSDAMEVMFDIDDLRMTIEDADNLTDLLHPEEGRPVLARSEWRALTKRRDELEDAVARWDEESGHFDAVNVLHSKVIGVIPDTD
jgi:hypothetical protein